MSSLLHRRRLLLAGASALGFPAVLRGASTAPLEEGMLALMKRYGIPGAALGIAKAGRLVYARGFGLAEKETGTQVKADSRFRIASLTKPFTAAAVMRLVEQGKLGLDERAMVRLGHESLAGGWGDLRVEQITVRHLLQHTGGWAKQAGDPLFQSPQICKETGIRGPADELTTLRWKLGQKLNHAPGTRFDYCNYGYLALGQLIETVTERSYAQAMLELVLRPCGIRGMELGRTLSPLANEVRYYHHDASLGSSVFPDTGRQVPWPYGTFCLETNAANGGYVASVADLLRFLTAMDERSSRPLLGGGSLQNIATGAAPGSVEGGAHYGLGWLVRPKGAGGRPNFWHVGGLPGTKTLMARRGDGFDWCMLFNLRPPQFDAFNLAAEQTLQAAVKQMTVWPTDDLFSVM